MRFVPGRLDGPVAIFRCDLLGFQNHWKTLAKVCPDLVEDRIKFGRRYCKKLLRWPAVNALRAEPLVQMAFTLRVMFRLNHIEFCEGIGVAR